MSNRTFNVLFLCTGNSARSILAEAILNHLGKGRFHGYSAGSLPKGEVHPVSLQVLRQHGLPTEGLRSKSWDEFARPDAPKLDFIFTVCDNAAGEVCPIWPGHPMTAHWGIADPAAVQGSEAEQHAAFEQAYWLLRNRIELLFALPFAAVDKSTLQRRLREIGSPSEATQ